MTATIQRMKTGAPHPNLEGHVLENELGTGLVKVRRHHNDMFGWDAKTKVSAHPHRPLTFRVSPSAPHGWW